MLLVASTTTTLLISTVAPLLLPAARCRSCHDNISTPLLTSSAHRFTVVPFRTIDSTRRARGSRWNFFRFSPTFGENYCRRCCMPNAEACQSRSRQLTTGADRGQTTKYIAVQFLQAPWLPYEHHTIFGFLSKDSPALFFARASGSQHHLSTADASLIVRFLSPSYTFNLNYFHRSFFSRWYVVEDNESLWTMLLCLKLCRVSSFRANETMTFMILRFASSDMDRQYSFFVSRPCRF
jgi:hypothetical protein